MQKHITDPIPYQGFMRLKDILKIIPISEATWWRRVKEGKYPKGIKLSANVTAWRTKDIIALLDKLNNST